MTEGIIQIPGYRMERHLGSGAMANVYLAVQESLDRQVALKLMAASLLSDSTFRERFLKEGKIIARLNHPNIITIYDIGIFQGSYYMAMEYVNGGTLKERILTGLTVEQAVLILRQIAAALGYAHKRGFVHRDVKPPNILFREDGVAVLSDFGIAKGFDDGTQMTAAGWTVGTPNYMSPEQALGKPVDARSDLYSLGIVFYEMLTGDKPYQGQDAFATALMHVNHPLPRLPDNLASFQTIIEGLLAKNPDERYTNAAALLDALDRNDATAIVNLQEEATQLIPRDTPSRLRYVASLLVLVFVLGGTAYYFLSPATRSPIVTETRKGQPPPESLNRKPLDDAARARIDSLLQNAKLNFDMGYLVYPYTLNAAYNYCLILALDPNNAAALKGLTTIAEAYQRIPDNAVKQDELGDSLDMVGRCLKAAPNHQGLQTLRDRIKQQQARGNP